MKKYSWFIIFYPILSITPSVLLVVPSSLSDPAVYVHSGVTFFMVRLSANILYISAVLSVAQHTLLIGSPLVGPRPREWFTVKV